MFILGKEVGVMVWIERSKVLYIGIEQGGTGPFEDAHLDDLVEDLTVTTSWLLDIVPYPQT